ncbi:zinc-dependent metalloprotease [Fodinicola feengrottensis]|uniref:zinc-dependent metalloprotease n=1 Tax=Fodinicola feengrottensis TaxID=435914 RepID=UPI002440F03C|nr:zinc-dependent metalloprotease [Fodinicola feengrottensis]
MTTPPTPPGFPGMPDPNDPGQMQAFLAQLQQMFATAGTSDGPVNWTLAQQIAEQVARPTDRSLTAAERTSAADAIRLADVWIDPVTTLPSGARTTAAWTTLEWIGETLPVWKQLCDPVASRVVAATSGSLPEGMAEQLGPMRGLLDGIGGMAFGQQVGTGLGQLSAEVLTSSDIGVPLGPPGVAALLPANIDTFAEGLERSGDEVRLYVALREAAHQRRLFEHVPWLRAHLLNSVDAYARGISVDREAIEDAMSSIDPEQLDPTNLESLQNSLAGGMFTPNDTPEQKAALARLETALALVEGWVTMIVEAAAGDRLPGLSALGEAFRRRRASGGPAEQTFATLVGLEMRPRKLREAAVLWKTLTEVRGVEGRDAIWGHPDLLPSSDDLDDPEAFVRGQDDDGLDGLADDLKNL